jgi:hypothetical protein
MNGDIPFLLPDHALRSSIRSTTYRSSATLLAAINQRKAFSNNPIKINHLPVSHQGPRNTAANREANLHADNDGHCNRKSNRMDTRITSRAAATPYDPLKHFKRNCALVKLAAMLIWRLPLILLAASGPVLWIGRAAGWW